jgi:hypothetical protein
MSQGASIAVVLLDYICVRTPILAANNERRHDGDRHDLGVRTLP